MPVHTHRGLMTTGHILKMSYLKKLSIEILTDALLNIVVRHRSVTDNRKL